MEALQALGPALVLVDRRSTCTCAHPLSGECWAALARFCSELISFLLQYIFADAYAQYLWVTFDFCSTLQGFSIPFRAADLLLHSKASNLLLGFDRSHPNKQVRELPEHCQAGLLEYSVLPSADVDFLSFA